MVAVLEGPLPKMRVSLSGLEPNLAEVDGLRKKIGFGKWKTFYKLFFFRRTWNGSKKWKSGPVFPVLAGSEGKRVS